MIVGMMMMVDSCHQAIALIQCGRDRVEVVISSLSMEQVLIGLTLALMIFYTIM